MQTMRFGRRLPIPSTMQIRHELIALMREDARRDALKAGVAVDDLPVASGPLPGTTLPSS